MPADTATENRTQGLSRGLVFLLAASTGLAVANIYYIQPLLNAVGDAFDLSDTRAGLLVTFAQIGYLVGLALLVPLGDLLERRRLITVVLIGVGVALAVCAAAPGFPVLAIALVVVGFTSVVAQILVPLAATLAAPQERGRVVGSVMSGLLIGILVARTVSGLLAEIGGWRVIFAVGAVAMGALSLTLHRALPEVPATERRGYPALLRSVLALIRIQPVLRQRMALAVLQMAGFSVLWSAIAFLLGGAPYHYGSGVIGLFGLAGAAGALMAPIAGRLADRGHGRRAMTTFLILILVSWALLAAGRSSLPALIVGVVLLDLGLQGAQISNQTAIYALDPQARSRLTTAYMVSAFLGGVVGSALSATVYDAAGWYWVCAVGAGFAATGLTVWGISDRLGVGRTIARGVRSGRSCS